MTGPNTVNNLQKVWNTGTVRPSFLATTDFNLPSVNEANGMQWWNWCGAVGVGTSSSADDAALNSRQGHGYKSWLDVESRVLA